jgi:hypothetical protein
MNWGMWKEVFVAQSEKLPKHLPVRAKENYDNTRVKTQDTILIDSIGLLTQYRSANHTTVLLAQYMRLKLYYRGANPVQDCQPSTRVLSYYRSGNSTVVLITPQEF